MKLTNRKDVRIQCLTRQVFPNSHCHRRWQH